MDISIKVVTREPEIWYDAPHCQGEITIGNYKEGFMVPLIYWTIADYEKQWKEGLERIKKHNTSCFVTRIGNPKEGLYAMIWCMYKIANKIYVRENLMISEILEQLIEEGDFPNQLRNVEFENKTCYQFIPPRNIDYSDGFIGEEWSVNLDNWN